MSTGTYTSDASAVGPVLGLWQYRELLRNLVVRDIKVRYKRSVLGFAWMLLNPLISMVVFTVIFREVFNMEWDYPLYVVSALMFYNFFSVGSAQGLNSIVASGGLIRKVSVPKAVFPLASVVANLVNFLLSLVPLAAVMLFTGGRFSPALVVVPVGVVSMVLFTYGVSLVLATMNVFSRDVRWFYDSALLILFYMTPIIYPARVVPERFRFILDLNPLTRLLDVFRMPIHEGRFPPASEVVVSLAIGVVSVVVGWIVFHRYEDRFINFV